MLPLVAAVVVPAAEDRAGVPGSLAASRHPEERSSLPLAARRKLSHRTTQHRRRGRAVCWFPVAYADRTGAHFPSSRGAEESATC